MRGTLARLRIRGGLLDGRTVDIRSTRCTVGRDPGCDLRLPGDGAVQAKHAVLDVGEENVVVQAVGSARVVVGGRGVRRATLREGERFRVGTRYELEVVAVGAAGRGVRPGSAPVRVGETDEAESGAEAGSGRRKRRLVLPLWLWLYLAGMAGLFGVLLFSGESGERRDVGLRVLAAQREWAQEHEGRCAEHTSELLEMAIALDEAGRTRRAAGIYRGVMASCPEKESPAYRYAAYRLGKGDQGVWGSRE